MNKHIYIYIYIHIHIRILCDSYVCMYMKRYQHILSYLKYGSCRCHTEKAGFGVRRWDILPSLFVGDPTRRHPLRRPSAASAQVPSGFITYHGFPKEKCFVLCALMSVKCTPQVWRSSMHGQLYCWGY